MFPNLENLGLTDKELRLYELLLKFGEEDAGKLIIQSGFKRPTTYKALYSLEKKGLVTQKEVKGLILFRPNPPEKLVDIADDQFRDAERARKDILALIPALTSAYLLSTERPVVSTFEGVKGLKQVYEDLLVEGKEILSMLTTAEVEPELFEWLTGDFVKRRAKLNIPARVIVASGNWHEEYMARSGAEVRTSITVPQDLFPLQHEAMVYGDKFALVNYKKGEKLIAVVINHPQIAKTMRAWFELAWRGAESINLLGPDQQQT